MTVVGVICEYNPFHNGHEKQLRMIRAQRGEAVPVLCIMSGNFVQRGEPAVFNKQTRAAAAVLCGADLVLELPGTRAVASAERFADGGVEALDALGCVDTLCFGCEIGDDNIIMSTARELLQPDFEARLLQNLKTGVSYAAARQQAMTDARLAACLQAPNNILAVEYCKALLRRGSTIQPMAIRRDGEYLAQAVQSDNPSALSLREAMARGEAWQSCVPQRAQDVYKNAVHHSMQAGERAVLARVRTLTDEEFSQLPYGSEGLWRRLMQACRTQPSVEQIISATKSKRYARSRLCRMLLCAYLGISEQMLRSDIPYLRILAFNERGRTLLRDIKRSSRLPVIDAGQMPPDAQYDALERRCADLYTLFACRDDALVCGSERELRNFYAENEKNACKK